VRSSCLRFAFPLSPPSSTFLNFRTTLKKKDKLRGTCVTDAKLENMYTILVGNLEREGTIWETRHRWMDNIKMNIREIGCEDVDWIQMDQDVVQCLYFKNTTMNLRVP
jgi:hypothetical protein